MEPDPEQRERWRQYGPALLVLWRGGRLDALPAVGIPHPPRPLDGRTALTIAATGLAAAVRFRVVGTPTRRWLRGQPPPHRS